MKCLKCGSDTILVNEENYEDISYNDDNYNSYPISICEEGEEWFLCKNKDCDTHHLNCPKCKTLCRFIGHSGIFTPDVKQKNEYQIYKIPPFEDMNSKTREYIQGLIEYDKINIKDWFLGYEVNILQNEELNQFMKDFPDTSDIPFYYVGDKNLLYAYGGDILITGPDGGFPHYWKCDTCNESYRLTDK
jgi:hypothetical protein